MFHYHLKIFAVTIAVVHSVVNKATHGQIWYCNDNPLENQPISPLNDNDKSRIKKLEQVQVLTRHGSRTHVYNLQRYFPNSKQYYHCNISTITSRVSSPIATNDMHLLSPMHLSFESDNQFLQHSNCQYMQSMPMLIQQHTQNAQIFINSYMSSSDDPTHLFDIKAIKHSLTNQYMRFYTSNKERCMLSTMVIASHLLRNSNTTSSDPLTESTDIIETITNDFEFNPYAPSSNVVCGQKEQYKEWSQKSNDDLYGGFITPKRESLLKAQKEVIGEYKREGGIWYDVRKETPNQLEHAGFEMALFYCNGFDIPLSNDTFSKMIDGGLQWISIQPEMDSDDESEREYAVKYQCVDHFMSIPMYSRFKHELIAILHKLESGRRFVLHSAHDSSIKIFLSGLGLYDGVFPYFAQFMTLEIYSSASNLNQYLFRFTNKGQFIPYRHCHKEYNDGESELCDLDILLNKGFHDVDLTQREWAEQKCATLLDDCVCGYCKEEEEVNDRHHKLKAGDVMIGALIGFIGAILVIYGLRIVRNGVSWYQRRRRGYIKQATSAITGHPENVELETIDNDSAAVDMKGTDATYAHM